jgi:HPt (histidine-containing phosphotransfer) domain-containing protein
MAEAGNPLVSVWFDRSARKMNPAAIITTTSHAMHGDRACCLAEERSEDVTEGLGMRDLESEDGSQSAMRDSGSSVANPQPSIPSSPIPPFNPDEAIRRWFNSRDMVREMIQCYFDEVELVLPQMRTALQKGDLAEVGRLGHRLKGTVVYLGAEAAKEAALRVERFGKFSGGSVAEAEEAIVALEHECLMLKAAMIDHPLASDLKPNDARKTDQPGSLQ